MKLVSGLCRPNSVQIRCTAFVDTTNAMSAVEITVADVVDVFLLQCYDDDFSMSIFTTNCSR